MNIDPEDESENGDNTEEDQYPSNTGPGGRELVNFLDDQGLLKIGQDEPDTPSGAITAMRKARGQLS